MRKSLVLLLTLALAFSLCLVSGAIELDVAENAAESVAAVEDNAALAEVTVAPGINVLTGDTSFAAFDTMPEAIKGVNEAITAYEIVDLDGDNVLRWTSAITTGTAYPRMAVALPLETGRKYYFTSDNMREGTNTSSDTPFWLMYDTAAIVATLSNDEYSAAMKAGDTWAKVSLFTGESKRTTSDVGVQTKIVGTVESDPCYYYFDDMAIIPCYKITYTGIGVDHILLDDDGNVLTSFTPNPEMAPIWDANDGQFVKFLGWTTTEGGTEPMDVIPLNNEDVTLYPIWKTATGLSSTWYMKGTSGTTLTITAAEAVAWSVDVGNSEATYTSDDTSLTITAAGYPGVVTVTAVSSTDETMVATKTIDVVGGGSYKPGLNMLTGTADVLDFEGKPVGALAGTPPQYNLYFNGVSGAGIVANPYTDYTGNDSETMLEMTFNQVTNSNTYPKFVLNTPTEADRPYQLLMKIASAQSGQYLWLNGDGNIAYGGNLNNTSANKAWYSISRKYTGERENIIWQYKASQSAQLVNHVDDVAVYPYYKITYIGLDGLEAYTEYVLYDDAGNFLTEYTPVLTNVSGANKLALDPDGLQEIEGNIPLEYSDITIYGIKTNDITFIVDGVEQVVSAEEATYTIGTPADIGFEGVENFLVWVDQNGARYYAGDVVNSEDMTGKNFTAFCQDVSKPAMGFSYEGDKTVSNAAKYTYQEAMEDDGRSVLHAHQYGSTWNGSAYATDPRIYLNYSEQAFDANEYNIVQYVFKMENGLRPVTDYASTAPADMPAEGVGVQEVTQTIIFYYPESGGNSYWQNYGECRVGGAHDGISMDGAYHTIEVDMSIASNGNTNGGEWKDRTIYGFAIDANKWATFASDVYVDYLRVYRDGVFSVTYDTNAPEGATVTSEVAADEGRGAGTGYLLKGEKPVVEGYTFVGWATTADASRADVVEAIDLTRDATVYAVWQKTEEVKNPTAAGAEYADLGENSGIRFKTSISAVDKDVVDEIGFIGTRESLLPVVESVADYDALTFDLKADGVKPAEDARLFVSGVAYNKAEGIDILNDESTETELIYSVVCKGIPEEYADEVIVVKPYVQLEINGNGITFYGEAITSTVNALK